MTTQTGLHIRISIAEIYRRCCKRCQSRIRQLIKEHITEEMVSRVLEEEN